MSAPNIESEKASGDSAIENGLANEKELINDANKNEQHEAIFVNPVPAGGDNLQGIQVKS